MSNVRLFRGDILNHSLGELVNEYLPDATELKMVSNLPYYITTPILFHFLEAPVFFSRLVIMVQLEVGQRLVAGSTPLTMVCSPSPRVTRRGGPCPPRTRNLLCAAAQSGQRDCALSASAARPHARGGNALCDAGSARRFQPAAQDIAQRLTHSGAFGAPKESVIEALEAVGIDPGRRPQTVSVQDWIRLAAEIRQRLPKQEMTDETVPSDDWTE